MPANWTSFILNVGTKLDGKGIEGSYDKNGIDVDDFATYLAKQYVNAIDNKAQSPYGNLHQKGNTDLIVAAFSLAYQMLEKELKPTLADKIKDPNYADLKEPLPVVNTDEYLDKFDLEFLAWAEKNGESIPDFVYSNLFSQFPNFPKTRDQQVLELARRIVSKFDGSSDYLQWIYTLKLDTASPYKDWSREVYNKILEITQGFSSGEIKVGDEVQALGKYNLTANGAETSTFNGFDLVRGKVTDIKTVNGEKIYKVSYTSQNRTIERTVVTESIQKKLNVNDFKNVQNVNISKEVFQEEHANDPSRIPDFVTAELVTRLTYSPSRDKNILYKILNSIDPYAPYYSQQDINNNLTSNNILYSTSFQNFINGDFSGFNVTTTTSYASSGFLLNNNNQYQLQQVQNTLGDITSGKIDDYKVELIRYMELKRRYVQELADAAKKNEDQDNPNDPYIVMANGIIAYWTSCLQQPLSANPPVPPCVITPPGNGIYLGIYYGSRKLLASNLKRAFNTGKLYKGPGAGTVVATALAFSFAIHLLELKFIYFGGIPTTAGPTPMIGLVPLVF